MQRYPILSLVAEVVTTFAITFGPIALALGEVARNTA